MRVHVISDMEGVAGIVKGAQTGGGSPPSPEGRGLYTEASKPAGRGAQAGRRDGTTLVALLWSRRTHRAAVVVAAALVAGQPEAARSIGLARSCSTQVDHSGQILLLPACHR